MKKLIKKGIIVLLGIILISGVLAFYNQQFLIKAFTPTNIKISAKNTTITENEINLDVQLILEESKIITYLADTIKYKVYLDNTLLIDGFYHVDKGILNGDKDTLLIPIALNRKTIVAKTHKFSSGDSTNLKLVFTNNIKLPLFGCEEFTFIQNIRIPAPAPPTIKVLNVTKKKLNLKDAIYQLDLDIYNPNYMEINIEAADVYIDIKKLFTGNARSLRPINIIPKGHSKISINIDIDDLQLIKDGFKIIMKPNKEWDYLIVAKLLIPQENDEPMELVIKNTGKTKLLGIK